MSIGSLRRRLPVAAKTALTTAGAMVAVPGSPMPPGAVAARDDVHLDLGSLVDAQDLVGVEVALLDAAVLERDLAVQGCGQPVHDAALHLRGHRVRVDHRAAVDRADHPLDAHAAILRHGDLGHLGDIAAETDR